MEVDEIQTQGFKFPRIGSGNKIGQKGEGYYPGDEEDGEVKRGRVRGSTVDGRFCGWPSSRIVRVSRASGGKDRHSKVLTSRGPRDRRIRLSVTTAIQFYDLQDRLGYDQPSKAMEWLLQAASSSIDELPSINSPLPETPKQLSDEKGSSAGTQQGFYSNEMDLDRDPNCQRQQQHVSLPKSACSSTSETSKGSGLSLSRSESRVKAQERARKRAAEKEKEKENESRFANHPNVHPTSQSSFTDLLTAGMNSTVNNHNSNLDISATQQHPGSGEANLFEKSSRQWSSAPMDCFTSRNHHHSSGFSGQTHLGNSLPISMSIPPFNVPRDHHQELQNFSFVPAISASAGGGGVSDYNLNFTTSSSLAGFSRGTLQSNSQSLSTLPHLQRLSPIDGSNLPLFIGTAAPVENHHQFPAVLEGRLQLRYGDGFPHTDQKGKGRN